MRRTARAALYLLSVPILATCGTDVVGTGEFIASILVTPGAQSLNALGLTQQFTATARSQSGGGLSGITFTWSSSAPNVVSIDAATGLATATANGAVTITARAEGVEGTASLTVAQVVTSITVTASKQTFDALQSTEPLTAQGFDSENNPVPSASFLWTSTDASVVDVNANGVATAMANGVATIAASANGAVGELEMFVSQVATGIQIDQQPVGGVPSDTPFAQQPVIQVVDRNGQAVAETGVNVRASIVSGGGTLVGSIDAVTDAAGAARYADLAIAGAAGARVLLFAATSLGEVLSQEVTVVTGPADPVQSTATLSGIPTAGQPLTVTLVTRDAPGNNLLTGGNQVTVNVTGASTVTPTVQDLDNGTYTATFNPTVAGTINIAVALNGTEISNSPFLVIIAPASVDGSTSVATVPNGTATLPTQIVVEARDSFGNTVTTGGALVSVNVSGSNSASPVVIDNGNGIYTASYVPTIAGTDQISITLNSVALAGSPFASVISTGTVDPMQSLATVPATGVAGVTTTIDVVARDAVGNTLTVGGASVSVNVSGANVASLAATDNGNGSYSASYTPTIAGTDDIAVLINGTAVGNSPFMSVVNAGAPSATQTIVNAPTNGTAGAVVFITMQSVDTYGNTVSTGGASFAVNVSGANPLGINVTDHGDGSYSASYTPTTAGTDQIAILLDGAAAGASPYAYTVNPAAADANQSGASVPSNGTVGVAAAITMQIHDAFGNLLTTGGDNVVVTIAGSNSATPAVTDNGDGTYATSYVPLVSGTDNVSITLNGVSLAGSPFSVAIGAGAVDPAQSTASVPSGGTAGTATSVTVQARDVGGNAVGVGGQAVVVTITGANNTAPPVIDNGNGTYVTSYTPTVAGADLIAVTMNGTPIMGSPFTSTVAPGAASAAQTTATVPAFGTSGNPTSIVVTTRDAQGNTIATGGAAVAVTISGANIVTPVVTDNGDGTYSTSYTPVNVGTDLIAITLNGASIGGSPYSSTIGSGAPDAAESSATIPSGISGSPTAILVQLRDVNGNNVTLGGATVAVSVTGANTVTPNVIDMGDGTYTSTYTPIAAGTDNIAVTLNGTPIGGSPYTSTVAPGAADASQSTASVPSGTAGTPTAITVQVRDANGNPLATGGETVAIVVTGVNPGSPTVSDNGDGTYSASYTPTVSGADNIAISLNGAALGTSPYVSTVVAGPGNAATSVATVPATATAGVTVNVSLIASDVYGNQRTTGGDVVVVTISGANTATPTVTDNGNGSYSASYVPLLVGTDNVAVTLNGASVNGSPFTTQVNPGTADPAQSSATVPATGTSGVVTQITIQARDAGGNPVTSGGDVVSVTITGANSTSPAVTDNGDGTYSTAYTPLVSGTDNVAITINSSPIGGSPYTSNVAAGPPVAAQTTATVPAGQSNVATVITVQARDANGNALSSGGASVVVTVSGANSASPPVIDNGNGTYTASYTPIVVGSDNVAITLNGTAIGASPFTSNVAAGPANGSTSTATVPATGIAGSPSNIVIQARDQAGNALSVGGATVTVNVTGANTQAPAVTDNGDGTYSTSYTPTTSGTDNIAIVLAGSAVAGSPFSSNVAPGPVDAAGSTATVPSGAVGVATNITVQARDANGNAVTSGGATVAIDITGANPQSLTVTDVGDGTYTANYVPTSAGTDNVAITLNATAIGGSPYTSVVSPGAANAAMSTATVPNGTVGTQTAIVIQSRDAYGNALTTGGATVVVSVTGSNTATPAVTDVGNGTYTTSYTPSAAGTDNVAITLNGAAIGGSPYTSNVGASHGVAANSYAIVPQGAPGIPTDIVVQARDGLNQKATIGGAAVVVTVTGANTASPIVTDNGNGTYSASYTPTASGSDNVAVTLDGSAILGSAYTSSVSVVTAVTGKISYDSDAAAGSGITDIMVSNEDGTGVVNLTNLRFASDERPSISPDGTKIAFNSNRDGDHDIYVMNINGSGIVQLTNAPGRDRHPVWSPDGTKILFLSERNPSPEVYVMNADGSNQTNLTNNSASDLQADWSPDGTKIVYYTSRDNDWFDLFTMNADGTNHQKLLDAPGSMEVEVTWGTGGIVFVSNMDTGSNLQVYKIQPDGTGLTRLTNHNRFDYMPAFNPDGSKIIFISNRTGVADVFIMNADGTGVMQITSSSAVEWTPRFQP